ncbi:MAG: hypothetical protein RLZZ306_674 [Bacteroidota bacterium]|jgi:uncharacterized protein with ATP-grasp and redox domains
MKITKAIKKDLELLNDPNLQDFERKLFINFKSLVTSESVGIANEAVKKEFREMLNRNLYSEIISRRTE